MTPVQRARLPIMAVVLCCGSAWAALPPTEGTDANAFVCHRDFEPWSTRQVLPQELPLLCRDAAAATPRRQ